jgi:hypothetical protein
MTTVILIAEDQNPNGRMLVQDGTSMHVLSGCCKERIDAAHVDSDGSSWVRCKGCNTPLDKNVAGWSSDLENIGQFAEYVPSGISAWGHYWFGLEDFAMTVSKS